MRILIIIIAFLSVHLNTFAQVAVKNRPNIIWLMAEDISHDIECYGMKGVKTPNLNKLAQEGIKYNRCYSANPICSPNRSAMMVGVNPETINAHDHRSNRKVELEDPYRPFTYWLRQAGYTCILGNSLVYDKGRKTDCNFKHSPVGQYDGVENFGLFDRFDTIKVEDQPFFAQIQLKVTHRGDWWKEVSGSLPNPVDPKKIELPPFMADHPVIRQDWARYLDQIQYMDQEIGALMAELEQKGLDKNTVIIFIGDNGRSNIRGKGYLYEPGIKIPCIIKWPSKFKAGTESEILISVNDITATILDLAGAEKPNYLEGKSLLNHKGRDHVYSTRDRWDEVVDRSRSITTPQYKYIRNDMPWVSYDAHQEYLEFYRPAVHIMRKLNSTGQLNQAQKHFFSDSKPKEELYDLSKDPHELVNLASDSRYEKTLNRMRDLLSQYDKAPNLTTVASWKPETSQMIIWLKENYPDKYRKMIAGEEIGYQKLKKEYNPSGKDNE